MGKLFGTVNVHGTIASFFNKVGRAAARRPWKFIGISVLIGFLLTGIYFSPMKTTESRGDKLWVPAGTEALTDQARYRQHYRSKVRRAVMLLVPSAKAGTADMLDKPQLLAALSLHRKIQNLSVTVLDATTGAPVIHNLTSLCVKRGANCLAESALAAWDFDEATLLADTDPKATLRARWPKDAALKSVVGGAALAPSGQLTAGAAIKTTYFLENREVFDKKEGKNVDKPAEAWEKAYIDLLKDAAVHQEDNLVVYYEAQRSRSDLFGGAIRGDLAMLGLAFGLMIAYLALQLGDRWICCFSKTRRGGGSGAGCCDSGSRVGLALTGVGATMIGIYGSHGVATLFGIFYGPVHTVLPFILLGLGVDDCFVIFSAFNQPDVRHLPLEDRLGKAMSRAGASITVTSVTDFVAFLIGSSSKLPALSSFCQYAALGILLILIFQVTIFAPAVALDQRRREQRRADLCCCFGRARCACCADGDDDNGRNASAGGDAEAGGAGAGAEAEAVSAPLTGLPRALGEGLAPALVKLRVPILLGVAALLGTTAWGAAELQVEDRRNDFIPAGSYMRDLLEKNAQYYCEEGSRVMIVAEGYDVATLPVQRSLGQLTAVLTPAREAASPYVRAASTHPDRTYHWLDHFLAYIATPAGNATLHSAGGTRTADGYATPSAAFYTAAKAWLAMPLPAGGARFSSDVVWKSESDPTQGIRASRMHAQHVSFRRCAGASPKPEQNDVPMTVGAMNDLRALVKATGPAKTSATGVEADAKTYAFGFEYPGWEGLDVIKAELIQNVCLALAAVFCVTVVLISHAFVAFLVCLCVAFTVLELLGCMYFWGLSIDTVSVINLVLAVGLAVDYAAHIAHCFMSKAGTNAERVEATMADIGAPVINGAVSTTLAVLGLAGSESYVFVVLFKQFLLTCIFGVFNGIIVLPVLLAVVGPPPHDVAGITGYRDGKIAEANADGGQPGADAVSAAAPSADTVAVKGGPKRDV